MTLPITLYGSYTCEDTAITRDRLNALRVSFKERAKEDDERVIALLGKYNQGMTRTPTLVFGDDAIVIGEPTLEQLEDSLSKAGYAFDAPCLFKFDFKRYILDSSQLPVIGPSPTDAQRDLPNTLLFFAHTATCRVCQGYARQISARCAQFEELGVRLQIVLCADTQTAKKWVEEFAPGTGTLVDGAGEFKRGSVDCFPDTWDIRTGGAWLLLVDQKDVALAGVYASDAGGLASPTEIVRFLTEQK